MIRWVLLLFLAISSNLRAEAIAVHNTQSISTNQLVGFSTYPPKVQHLINLALGLTQKRLGYLYGSHLPTNGGMDCSGTIYYLLVTYGLKEVPRSSEDLYQWVKIKGNFKVVRNPQSSTSDFSKLNPGDLLFWTGTYKTPNHNDVSHVMIYLGKNKEGQPLMIGASNGRTYQGKKVYGVSVFDFYMAESRGHFLGYSCIPEVNC